MASREEQRTETNSVADPPQLHSNPLPLSTIQPPASTLKRSDSDPASSLGSKAAQCERSVQRHHLASAPQEPLQYSQTPLSPSNLQPPTLRPKRKRSTPELSQDPPSLPLTESNLRLLDGTNTPNMAPPATPASKKSKAKQTMDTVKPERASDVELVLELNNMFQQDKKAYTKYPSLKELVDSIITHDRGSVMSRDTVEELMEIREVHEKSDEMTFLVPFITTLIAKKRMVKPTELKEPMDTSEQWIERAWSQEMLRSAYQQQFKIETLPVLETNNVVHQKMLEELPRVTRPVHDLLFGLFRKAFTTTERQINAGRYGCVEVSDQSAHSFFLIECKTKGSIADAINQACRGGAALVHARRHFNAFAEPNATTSSPTGTDTTNPQPPIKSFADLRSIAFSMELNAQIAYIYVHWAEIQLDEPVRYHMNLIAEHSLASLDGEVFVLLRRRVDNILDWGTLKRKREIEETIKTIQAKILENPNKESSRVETSTTDDSQPSAKRQRTVYSSQSTRPSGA